MGYSTNFNGGLRLGKLLTNAQMDYIHKFNDTRRMKRDINILMETFKGKAGYPGRTPEKNTALEIYGNEGEFYVGGDEKVGVLDHNTPPGKPNYGEKRDFKKTLEVIKSGNYQPGLWCQWTVTEEVPGTQIFEWDGGEKFYEYIQWLKYLIKNFFEPWGVKLNGEITWEGESSDDLGKIVVTDNVVEVFEGDVHYKKSE